MRARRIAREALRAHKINDGDLLVFDRSKTGIEMRDVRNIGKYLSQTGRGDCILIIVENMDGVHVFDEAEMEKQGWIRKTEGETPGEGS